MSATKLSADTLLAHIRNRRSIYPLSKELTISSERIETIVAEALKWVPSSFNSQSNRVVLLLGAEHDKFWDLTAEALRPIVSAEQWAATTAGKMAMFRGAAGTVLFFEDQDVVDRMSAKFTSYAEKFPVWATQSDAMLQFTIWTALEAEGLGANIQHYNPIVDAAAAAEWKLPSSWKLNAQIVFGGKTAEPAEKTFTPIDERLKVFSS